MAWLTHWGIDENNISQNIDNAKNIITSMFKDKLWREEKLAVKRKLRYYNEVIKEPAFKEGPNVEIQ